MEKSQFTLYFIFDPSRGDRESLCKLYISAKHVDPIADLSGENVKEGIDWTKMLFCLYLEKTSPISLSRKGSAIVQSW